MAYPIELKNECTRLYVKYGVGTVSADDWITEMWNEQAMLFPFIEMVITTKCNLKCKFCSNLIPYYQNPCVEKKEDVFNWIDILSQKAKYVFRLKIHGGEPLTHPDIAEIITYACSKENILDVRLSTNGTIIPDKTTLLAMTDPKFRLHISDYEKSCGIKTDKLEFLCKQLGINLFKMKDEPWQNLGGVSLRDRPTCDKIQMIKDCNMSMCRSFQKGFLYVCSRAGHGERQGHFVNKDVDYLNFNGELTFDNYLTFFGNYNFAACDYCDGAIKGKNEIPAGEQIK